MLESQVVSHNFVLRCWALTITRPRFELWSDFGPSWRPWVPIVFVSESWLSLGRCRKHWGTMCTNPKNSHNKKLNSQTMRKKLRIINFYFFVLFLTAIYYCWKLYVVCNSIFFLDCCLGVCWSEAYLEKQGPEKREEDVKAKTCLELALEEEKVFDSVGGLGMLEENKKAAGVWCKRLSRYPPDNTWLGQAGQLGLLSTWQTDHHRPPSRWRC